MDYPNGSYYTVYLIERRTSTERVWSAIDVKLFKKDAVDAVASCRHKRTDAQFRVKYGQVFTR